MEIRTFTGLYNDDDTWLYKTSQLFLVLSPCLQRHQEMSLMTSLLSVLLATVQVYSVYTVYTVYTQCTGLCQPRSSLSRPQPLPLSGSRAQSSSSLVRVNTVPGKKGSRLQVTSNIQT